MPFTIRDVKAAFRIGAAIALIACSIVMTSGSADAAPAVSIAATPDKVTLPPGGTAPVLVTITNEGTSPITALGVTADDSTDVVAAVATAGESALAPATSTVWRLDVRRRAKGILPAQLPIRVRYASPAGQSTVATSIGVTSATTESPDTVARVTVQSGLKTLDDFHGGTVTLVVANTSARPITVRSVDVMHPDHVNTKPKAPDGCAPSTPKSDVCVLDVGQTATIPYAVTANNITQSGNDVLIFRVRVASGDTISPRGDNPSVDIVAAHDITLGLFGESELAKLFQIPTITLVPGFLLVAAVALLWRLGLRPQGRAADKFPVSLGDGEFWVLSVLISILFLGVFRLLSGRNPLSETTVRDTAYLSGYALLIAFIAYGAPMLVVSWRTRRRRLAPGMTALETLTRLGRRDSPRRPPRVTAGDQDYFLLETTGDGALVSHPIVYEAANVGAATTEAINQARNRETLRDIARLLRREEKANHLVVRWDPVNAPPSHVTDTAPAPGGVDIVQRA
ncbi:MAG: hypothetical protein QOF30_899 [Acidimicrobiaceae bacterium]|nr:hypothetical protein [Acidimicrobiaceae bacterium]